MKLSLSILLSFFCISLFAQELSEKKIISEVNEVTVFLDGAQVTRTKTVDMTKGTELLRFVNLSPFIDENSIRAKVSGDVNLLSVSHSINFLDELDKPAELIALEGQRETIDEKIELESAHLSVITDELRFLNENRNIGGKNAPLTVTILQQASDFYGKKLTSLKLKQIERQKILHDLQDQRRSLQEQINVLTGEQNFSTGEIVLKLDVKKAGKCNIELSYMVGNAGWFPSYDIRANNVSDPVELVYKANVKQDTKVDWKNVKLRFSSAEPNVSGVAPELQPYLLNYNSLPPGYKTAVHTVSGRIVDEYGGALSGVNVMIPGSTIAAVSDYSGRYSITLPNNTTYLTFSYIGYISQTRPVTGERLNVVMEQEVLMLEEMEIAEEKPMRAMLKKSEATVLDDQVQARNLNSIAAPVAQAANQTSVDFDIKMPYTVKSDNENYAVEMVTYELPASYQYYSVPKVDKDAFLIAHIVDWERYNLLEGEANIFFEDTYVGKTLLDVRFASDTLEVSLGRDKTVSVQREKTKDYSSRQFIGTKKEENRIWKITVKNNKTRAINMIVLDQVPVSTLEEIEVLVPNVSGGKRNLETGEVRWQFNLAPYDTKELTLKYSVKYPKGKTLTVE